jgi:hypothetical protein
VLDYSALAAIAPAAATVFTTLGAVVLAWIARLRRKDELEARLAAKDNPELLESITKSMPTESSRSTLPILLLVCGAGLTIQSGINALRYNEQYAAADLKKKCPGGCPPESTCNPKTGACEAQATKPEKPIKPKRIDEPRIVRYPLHHDARVMRQAFWEPLDCKLNDCSDLEEDEL